MSKTKEEMNGLSVLLNNTGTNKADIDNAPEEFKKKAGRPKKITQTYVYCGMIIPKEIYDICMYLEDRMKDANKYTVALQPQVFNAAVQMWVYSDLITAKISGREPVPTRSLTTASESYRRSLGGLGLVVMDKKGGIIKEEVGSNPLTEFMNAMKEDEDEVLLKKKKNKGGH